MLSRVLSSVARAWDCRSCGHRFESGSTLIPNGVVGNISACHADAPGSIPGSGASFLPVSLVGQDIALSPRRPGFKSRTGNFLTLVATWDRTHLAHSNYVPPVCQHGRVVKASDLKSDGHRPRRFKSCC